MSLEVIDVCYPQSVCCCGMEMRHRHGWSCQRSESFNRWGQRCHRPSKESLREYKRWLEEEMKFVDEELKKEEAE